MQETSLQSRQKLFEFIDKNCIFRPDPAVVYGPGLQPGETYPQGPRGTGDKWLFQLRRLTHNAEGLHMIGYHIAQSILKSVIEDKEFRDVQLAGLETSSMPIISSIQLAFLQAGVDVNAFTVRKERKSYGLCNLIEGIPNEHPVVFIDDIINSGNSMVRLYDAVYYELGLRPAKNAYCVIQYQESPNMIYNDWLVKVNTIFLASEFEKAFDPEKYWLPEDVKRDVNKRSHYV